MSYSAGTARKDIFFADDDRYHDEWIYRGHTKSF